MTTATKTAPTRAERTARARAKLDAAAKMDAAARAKAAEAIADRARMRPALAHIAAEAGTLARLVQRYSPSDMAARLDSIAAAARAAIAGEPAPVAPLPLEEIRQWAKSRPAHRDPV